MGDFKYITPGREDRGFRLPLDPFRKEPMWDKVEAFILQDIKVFAIVINCEEHWAWYVIDDEDGDLVKSGSDDDLSAAKENAERELKSYISDIECEGETNLGL